MEKVAKILLLRGPASAPATHFVYYYEVKNRILCKSQRYKTRLNATFTDGFCTCTFCKFIKNYFWAQFRNLNVRTSLLALERCAIICLNCSEIRLWFKLGLNIFCQYFLTLPICLKDLKI